MKTLIAIPCMDMVQSLFLRSCLAMRIVGTAEYTLSIGSLIYDARNNLAKKALEEDFDRVLWLDSDMTFEPDLMERLSARLDEGLQYVSGLYFKRRAPHDPVIYKECGMDNTSGVLTPFAHAYIDYPRDQLFQIAASGFGAVMMTTDLLRRVSTTMGLPFSPVLGFGEDLSFCMRASQLGEKLYCDSSIKLGHIGFQTITEEVIK